MQVGAQVIGNDTAITIGGLQGNFELNVRIPLIARNLLGSIHLLTTTSDAVRREVRRGHRGQRGRAASARAEATLAAATALNPYIGYDKGAEIVKEAADVRADAARGRARAGRRPGRLRRGDGPAQDGARFVRVSAAMTPSVRSRALLIAALLLAALTLAACGGDDDDSSSGDAAKPSASDAAQDRKDIARLIKQAFGPNEKARSGRLDGTIDLEVKGVPRYKGPIEVSASGGFELASGADVPDFRMDVGLVLNDHAIGGELVLADDAAFIQLGTTGYKLPDSITSKITAPAAALDNGLAKTAGMFFIRPDRWQKNGRIVGDEQIAGEDTEHAVADIRANRFFEDVARLVRLLTMLRVTEAVGIPQAVTPAQRRALARSVETAKGEVWVGKEDHVLRRAQLTGSLSVAKKDRKVLGGMTSATLTAMVNITDVSQPQKIEAPDQLGNYDDLQLALDALGESIRNELRGK